MRVIAGTARGIRLESPKNGAVRPTLDRVREALFNIWQDRVSGARFLDCYAGSGANGVEALSRGAREAVFVERDPEALGLIRRNLDKARLADRARILRLALPEATGRIGGAFDLVFADPPYGQARHDDFLRALDAAALVAPGGAVCIEHGPAAPPPEETGPFRRQTSRRYGDSTLSFYEIAHER